MKDRIILHDAPLRLGTNLLYGTCGDFKISDGRFRHGTHNAARPSRMRDSATHPKFWLRGDLEYNPYTANDLEFRASKFVHRHVLSGQIFGRVAEPL